ncbi:MAG: glycosyltransferase [bacterium]
MKILYIVHKFWRPTIGGTQNYYADFFNEIAKYHNIRILAPIKTNTKINTDDNIITVPAGYVVNPNGRFPMYHYHSVYNRKIENIFQSAIGQYQPDIIHFQHFLGLPFRCWEHAINTKIPVVVTIHDFWTLCPRIHFYDTEEKICEDPRKGEKCVCCTNSNLRVRENIKMLLKDIFLLAAAAIISLHGVILMFSHY